MNESIFNETDGRITTLEEAMRQIGDKIASPEFISTLKDQLDYEGKVTYSIFLKQNTKFEVGITFYKKKTTKKNIMWFSKLS